MKRFLLLPTAAVLAAGLAGPAHAQTDGDRTEIVSIDPTSGPLGTEITVTVRNCPGGNADGTARLDFAFNGFTPANTTFFYGDADGAEQTATITAQGGEGKQNPGQTDAFVALSQCTAVEANAQVVVQQADADGTDRVNFTVTPGATTTTAPSVTSTSAPPRTGTLPATGAGAGAPILGAVLLGAGSLLVVLARRPRHPR